MEDKYNTFIEMYRITYPDDIEIDNDYQYLVSPYQLTDLGCFTFAVSDGEQTRLLASQLDYIVSESTYNYNEIDIAETFIENVELQKMALALDHILI